MEASTAPGKKGKRLRQYMTRRGSGYFSRKDTNPYSIAVVLFGIKFNLSRLVYTLHTQMFFFYLCSAYCHLFPSDRLDVQSCRKSQTISGCPLKPFLHGNQRKTWHICLYGSANCLYLGLAFASNGGRGHLRRASCGGAVEFRFRRLPWATGVLRWTHIVTALADLIDLR